MSAKRTAKQPRKRPLTAFFTLSAITPVESTTDAPKPAKQPANSPARGRQQARRTGYGLQLDARGVGQGRGGTDVDPQSAKPLKRGFAGLRAFCHRCTGNDNLLHATNHRRYRVVNPGLYFNSH
jgi:hypothetical protein